MMKVVVVSQGNKPAHGFVLPVVIIMLAIISAAVLLMSHRGQALRTLASQSLQEQRDQVVVENAMAQALYLSSILYRRQDRMGLIELAGRVYRSEATGAVVRYQDAGGLMNLRRIGRSEYTLFLRALGATDPMLIDSMADRLLDYTDTDDLERLNGAEASAYQSAKLPVPRNAPLVSPYELERIYGWHDVPPALREKLLQYSYVGSNRGLSLYTVTAPVLAAAGNTTFDIAADLIAQRLPGKPVQVQSLPSVRDGSYLAIARYGTLPSETLIITACARHASWCQLRSITSTGDSNYGPWHVDYSLRIARPVSMADSDKLTALPDTIPPPPPPLFSPFGFMP